MVFWSSLYNKIKANKILFIIFIGGLIIRLLGTNPGYFAHGDEVMYGEAMYMLLNKTLSMEINLLGYPPLVAWIMLISFVLFFIPLSFILFFVKNFEDTMLVLGGISQNVDAGMVGLERIFHNEILGGYWINAMYWGRYLTAICGALLIVFTYKLVISYFKDKRIALVSCFLTAVNYRLVLSSYIGLPDMYNTLFFILSLLATGNLINKPSKKNYTVAWVSVALFFLVKFQIYALLPLVIAHLWTVVKGEKIKVQNLSRLVKSFFNKNVILGGLISLLIVAIGMYYHFLNWEEFMAINEYQALKYGFGKNLLNIFPVSYFFHTGIGPAASLLGTIGIIYGISNKKLRLKSIILLSPLPVLFFLYLFYTSGGFFTRNLISVIPLIIVFASVILVKLADLIDKNKKRSLVLIVLFTFFISQKNIVNSATATAIYMEISPMTRARNWIQDNISGDFVYGVYHGYPSPNDEQVNVVNLTPPGTALSFKELVGEGFDYITLDLTTVHDTFLWWMGQAPEVAVKFWEKPNDLLSQTYSALAVRELLWNHTLNAFLTPWQAPGYNFAAIKLQKPEQYEGLTTIKEFDFKDDDWKPLFFLEKNKDQLKTSEEGGVNRGSLIIERGGSLPGTVRWESSVINIKPQHGYVVRGSIKSDEIIEKTEREGFLRLDFYENLEEQNVLSRPIISFVSERYFGDGEWKQFEISGVAPINANYAVIGFQADSVISNFYLDNISVLETENEVLETEIRRFIIKDDDFFLPNNQGFL